MLTPSVLVSSALPTMLNGEVVSVTPLATPGVVDDTSLCPLDTGPSTLHGPLQKVQRMDLIHQYQHLHSF